MREVVLYTRAGCSLCTQAKDVLLQAQRETPFALREVDIGSSGPLWEEHRYDIPVIAIDGVEAFRHRVTLRALKERL